MDSLKRFGAYLSALPRYYQIGSALLIIAAAIAAAHFFGQAPATESAASGIPHVKVASVADLSAVSAPLSVVGTVTSLSQASILAQSSGEITILSRAIGDRVGAGAIIAEFENSSQQAAVQQAQGAYDAAEAALAKANGSTAQNSTLSSLQANQSAQNAQTSAAAALSSTYAALDDAIHTKADTLFTNPRTSSPQIALTVPDSALVATLQASRVKLEDEIADARTRSGSAANANIDANSSAVIADVQFAVSFLDNLIRAVNETTPSQNVSAAALSADQSLLAAARTEAVGAIASLTAAKSAYDAATSGASAASNSAGSGTANDIAIALANAKQAQGALNAAKANLEKSIVRSPISGTIVSLPVTQGDYVSAFSPVAVVSNPGALYVSAQVTSDDAKTLAVGNAASVDGGTRGVITFVAPALDPATGRIEVKVGMNEGGAPLTDGDVVPVSLDRSQSAATASADAPLTIPIIAAKITPAGPVVFTITASSMLAARAITLGSILGDRVVVASGLTADMRIVTDARGLADGQTVVVDPE